MIWILSGFGLTSGVNLHHNLESSREDLLFLPDAWPAFLFSYAVLHKKITLIQPISIKFGEDERMHILTCIRKRCNISLGELAEILGVSRQAISSWENGHKEIPAERKKQLALFFGLDEDCFGNISEKEKKELLEKPLFRWEGLDKEAYLYRKNEEAQEMYRNRKFFGGSFGKSLDEAYIERKKSVKELLENIESSIRYIDEDQLRISDQLISMNRGLQWYGRAYELLEGMKKQEARLRMPHWYLLIGIMEAAARALLGRSAYVLPKPGAPASTDFMDPEWIQSLSEIIRERWNLLEESIQAKVAENASRQKEGNEIESSISR